MNKKLKKLCDKRCFFCPEDNYECLDLHRIIEGHQGGKYEKWNVITTCANCHRRVHSGIIKIFRKYLSTRGWVLHYIDENGEEHFSKVN